MLAYDLESVGQYINYIDHVNGVSTKIIEFNDNFLTNCISRRIYNYCHVESY